MTSQIHNSTGKLFLIKIYPKFWQIEKAIQHIIESNSFDLQLSILGKLSSRYFDGDNNLLDEKIMNLKGQLSKALGHRMQFGHFYNPEIGILFITGHLTQTFLRRVNEKELGSLPAGIFGIFRGIGIELEDRSRYFRVLQNGDLLLIIRGENKSLASVEKLLKAI